MAKKLYEDTTDRASYGGSVYDQQYFTDDELRAAAAARAAAESGETNWQSAHDYVEGIRNKYGYAGGADGSGYIAVSNPTTQPVKSTAPSYVSKYQTQIDTLKDAMMNRTPFSYDALSDPLYQQYRKQYTREAGRSAADVLGKAAALTGGMPSTAAITASQQASDYQMAQMNDKIPELYQLAHSMYMNEGNRMNDQLNMLLGLEQNDYNRYLTDREYEYQLGRDALSDQRYADELAYARLRDAIEDARYEDETAYERELAAQKLAQQGSKSGSGGTSSSGKPKLTAAQTLSALEKGIVNEETKAAYEYWYGQPWEEANNTITDVSQLGQNAMNIANSISRANGSVAQRAEMIEKALDEEKITEAEADFLLSAIGY